MFENKTFIKPLIFGLVFSIITTLIFLMIFAFTATNIDLSDKTLLTLSIISMNIGTFVGGLISGKIIKEKGFIIGAINGFIVFLILSLLSLFFNKSSITIITLIKLITFVFSSMVGGVIGVNISIKRRF